MGRCSCCEHHGNEIHRRTGRTIHYNGKHVGLRLYVGLGNRRCQRYRPNIIDANGIVNVKAKDLGTNKEQSITITSSTNLSDDEIERMRKEAEENKEADEKRKEEVEIRNEAEQMVFQTEKAIKDLGDKADKKEVEAAEDLIKDLKKALEDGDIEEIKKEKEKLQEKAMAMSAKVYEEEAKKRQAEQEETEDEEDEKPAKKDKKKKKKDDVEEADIEEE